MWDYIEEQGNFTLKKPKRCGLLAVVLLEVSYIRPFILLFHTHILTRTKMYVSGESNQDYLWWIREQRMLDILSTSSCFLGSFCWLTMCSSWKCVLHQVHEPLSNVIHWLPVLWTPVLRVVCLRYYTALYFLKLCFKTLTWSQWLADAIRSCHSTVSSFLLVLSCLFLHVSYSFQP